MSQAEITARNNADIAAAMQSVLEENLRYWLGEAKEALWRDWCVHKRAFDDGANTSEEKLLLFLREVVLPQGETRPSGVILFPEIEDYVKGIETLYRMQKFQWSGEAQGGPKDPNGLAVKAFLKPRRQIWNRQRRGIGVIPDPFKDMQLKAVNETWLSKGTLLDLRARLDFMLSRIYFPREQTKRDLRLTDVYKFFVGFTTEGYIDHSVLVISPSDPDDTKSKSGKQENFGAVRHRDPECCLFNAVGFYLLMRFSEGGEPFPDLSSRRAWYDLYLLTRDVKLERHDYNSQAAPATPTVKAEDTASPASTAGTTELSIRRAGHYPASAVLIPSRTTVPMDAIRSAAGFSTEDDAALLPRAAVAPPEDLQKQLFPQIEEWSPRLDSRNAETQDMAAVGFCKLLKELRVVLLQDAAQLINRFPNSAIWRHSVFSSDAFNEFKHQVHAEAHTSAEADTLALQRALPILSTTIARGFEGLSARSEGVDQALQSISAAITTAAAGGRIRASVAERHVESATSDVSAVITTAARDLGSISYAGGLDIVESSPSNTPTPARVTPSNPRRIPRVYVLAKGLSSITDVWKEYDEGLEGGPPVREMERVHGRHWRADDTQGRYFRKRKQVYDAVKRVAAAKSILASVAAENLEVERLRRRQTVPTFSRSIASVASELLRQED
ncbi:hypothetical protein BBJ28_00022176 [Nothophytophthora sp. Chile5]|nr:hypothetical protein BBJ28_00022176 [Nothophytophthora sp. Chile5]